MCWNEWKINFLIFVIFSFWDMVAYAFKIGAVPQLRIWTGRSPRRIFFISKFLLSPAKTKSIISQKLRIAQKKSYIHKMSTRSISYWCDIYTLQICLLLRTETDLSSLERSHADLLRIKIIRYSRIWRLPW